VSKDDAVLALARQLAGELDPAALRSKWREYGRGGLPNSSIPEAISKSSEPPLPMLDADDRRIADGRIAYRRKIQEACDALQAALRIQNSWLIVSEALPDVPVRFCGTCSEAFSDSDTQSAEECARCRQHRRRNGEQWPNIRTDGKKDVA
jgi:hypothetical protein